MRESRVAIKAVITRDWREILEDFGTTLAMEDDAAFRTELEKRLDAQSPLLSAVLSTSLPTLVYQEYRGAKESSVDLDQCFGGTTSAGVDVLLNLDRKRLLSDVRMLLPVWYAIPIVSWIVRLFMRGAKRRSARKASEPTPRLSVDGASSGQPVNSRAAEFGQMARAAEQRMLPKGQTLDEYLWTLSSRWNTLLDPTSKANLTEDINSLVRDFLRTSLRSMRPASFTPERIESMAAMLADRPNLLRIRNHQALEEYIRLYIIKMLKR
jgi:hypothetical protein